MPEFDSVLAACRPVDLTRLNELLAGRDNMPPLPAAMTDDTIGQCAKCGCEIWVGPRKRILAALGRCELICYACLAEVMEARPGASWAVANLNPNRIERPRT